MIDPKELRIGNWVNYEGKPVRAICVGTSLRNFDCRANENPFCMMSSENQVIDSADPNMFSPMELTGAILQKVGFAKYSLNGYTEHFEYSKFIGGEVIRITALHDCHFSITLHHTARHIASLHDLQNKIFAVTGEELEVEFKEI